MINVKGSPLPIELKQLGIRGLLLQDGVQVTADTAEKTLGRTKAIAFYLCNHPSRRHSGTHPETGESFEIITGGTVHWTHPDTGEEIETPIGEWARTWMNPEPTPEQLQNAARLGMDETAIVDWIVDPFHLIRITSPPQT